MHCEPDVKPYDAELLEELIESEHNSLTVKRLAYLSGRNRSRSREPDRMTEGTFYPSRDRKGVGCAAQATAPLRSRLGFTSRFLGVCSRERLRPRELKFAARIERPRSPSVEFSTP